MGLISALVLLTYSKLPVTDAVPSARYDPPLIYDAPANSLLLFGGADAANRNDLWRYLIDEKRWVELQPAGTLPPERFGHATVFDSKRRRLVLFGGQANGFFSDVWAYDIAANQWTQLAKSGAGPSSRYGHSGIYDRKRDRLVISHGFTDAGRFDDTWAFDLGTNRWTNISPSGIRPLKRCLHHAAYDEAGGRMLLFGGCSSGFGKCPQDDLWSLDLNGGSWQQLPSGPPARERYAMAFDTARERLVIFGGSGFPLLNDTWSFDVRENTWSQVEVSGDAPSPRSRVEGVSADAIDTVFWFGGLTDSGLSNELFGLRLSGARVDRIANAFSGESGAIAPGELVSLFGSGLEQPVTFDGIGAATSYVGGSQINARVPEALTAGQAVMVKAGSASATVQVNASQPGLFGTIFNGDGTPNSVGAAAGLNSVVVLYSTGTGALPVQVTVGGTAAEIVYSGPLAGSDGVTQTNVRVPATAASGKTQVALVGGNAGPLFIQ